MFIYAKGPEGATKHYIANTTAIAKGTPVTLTTGTGVVQYNATDWDDPILGFMASAHASGDGTECWVHDNPETIFSLRTTKVYTATAGSATTFVDDSLLPATNNLFKGGVLEVVTCAADSGLIGKKIPITASTGAGGTITFGTQPAAFAAGDTAKIHLGPLAVGEYGWDLNATWDDIDLDTSGGTGLVLVGADPDRGVTYWKIRQHLLAGYVLTI